VAVDYRADDFVAVTNDVTEAGRRRHLRLGRRRHVRPVPQVHRFEADRGGGVRRGRITEAPTNHLLVKNYGVLGLHWSRYRLLEPDLVRRCHDELVALHASGAVRPLIGSVRPLDEVPRALADLAGRATVGKVVVVP
jgi:NADPH:quinone reductase-like Zn-dependent oxidoreductase